MRPSAIRRQVLEDWRGLPDPTPDDTRCKSLREAIEAAMPRFGLADRLDEAEVRAAWAEIVGEFLAANSAPESLRKGELTIAVIQPTVRYELERGWKPKVLARLQQRFGAKKIRSIRFR